MTVCGVCTVVLYMSWARMSSLSYLNNLTYGMKFGRPTRGKPLCIEKLCSFNSVVQDNPGCTFTETA